MIKADEESLVKILSNVQSPFECGCANFTLLDTALSLTAASVAVCTMLRTLGGSFYPSSLSLIALDAQEALFSSPSEALYFFLCGCKVGLA